MDPSRVLQILPRADPTPTLTSAEEFLVLVSDPFKTQVQSQALFASLVTSLGITGFIALVFCFLRPYNTTVYAPRLRHADEKHAPPQLGKGPFAWLSPVLKTKEQVLVEKVGMDATIFIRFTTMCRNIFLVLTILLCSILIPVNIVGGKQFTNNAKGISNLVKMTPQFLIGPYFWALVASAWLIDLVVCGFLWWNYRAVTKLRRDYFDSAEYQTSLHARTIMVTEIPKSLTSDEGIVQIMDSINRDTPIPHAAIARNVKELPDLIEEHEDLVRGLEKVFAKYFKRFPKLPPARPTCKVSKRDPAYVKGEKVDAIDYLTTRIQHLEKRIREVRDTIDQRDSMPYGFASYQNIEDAHNIAYAARNKSPKGVVVRLAPRPSDIIWKNLLLSKKMRKARSLTNNFWIALLTLVWIAPNALIAVFLSNLGNLGAIWPAFNNEFRRHEKLWAVVQGVLAPAITSLFYFILPSLFRRLSIQAGDLTKTSRERHVTSKLYFFFTFNNLFIFSMFGAIWGFAAAVIQARQKSNKNVYEAIKEQEVWTKIMIALCNVSPFWVTWLLQRNLGAAVDLSQVVNLAWGSFARRFLSPTPRQVIELSAPPPFDYASYYNYFLFYATVALCFATLQPIVLPVTAFYFALDCYLKKYLIMYVFVTKTESGGQFWRVLFNRFLVCALLSNIVVAALVVAKAMDERLKMLIVLAPLPILLVLFKLYCMRTFDDQIHYYTRGVVSGDAAIDSDGKSRRSDRVGLRFGHPAMFKPLMTVMVREEAQGMLGEIYKGRLDDDYENEATSLAGYSDVYSLRSLNRGHRTKKSGSLPQTMPFEFVSESQMDFENFKDRPDFRSEFGGEGDLYGKHEDQVVRGGTPVNGSRGESRDSERTFTGNEVGSAAAGTTYPPGYSRAPVDRSYNPSPDRFARGNIGLLGSAAPMGDGSEPLSRATTPGEEHRGRVL